MALTKNKKNEVISEVTELLNASKLTVVAKYEGTGVKALQGLRRDAKANGTKVKVVKNRLVIQALKASDTFKDSDTSAIEGMLLYAFNSDDEVAPAQSLNDFAKKNPTLEFVGGFTAEGKFIGVEEVKALAVLPGKPLMIAGILNTLNAPIRNVVGGLSGNLPGILSGLEVAAKPSS
jgi:large subunit ribosomal protein L10